MKHIYLVLAALMLLCLAPMPYGYFQLVRFVAMVAFGMIAYRYYVIHKNIAAWVFGLLALLFQPFLKIALGRTIWNVIDVLVAILLIAIFVYEKRIEQMTRVHNQPLPPDDKNKIDGNKFTFQIEGKLGPKELIYVASEEDKELTDYFEKNPDVLEGWGKMIGFQVIYLPLLMKRLADVDVVRYRAPYLKDSEVTSRIIGNDFLLEYLENPDDRKHIKQGFIRTSNIQRKDGEDKAINRFYPLSSQNGEPINDQLHRIGKQISDEKIRQERLLENRDSYDDWGGDEKTNADDCFNSQISKEDISDLIDEVKERIAKLRQRGISQYILEQLIHPDDRLSKLIITSDYRILLPDYNDLEIKMEPLVKAVYLLFLKHPEGILFKHLPDYRQELTEIYVKLKPNGLNDRALQSIEDVTNPLLNSINEKCARIRGAFLSQFDDHMAKHYYIDGLRGEAKKISLPPDMVEWEEEDV